MDPEEEINVREEIVRTVGFLVDFLSRIRERNEQAFQRLKLALLRRNGKHKSVVRWIADNLPNRALDWSNYDYNTVWQSVFSSRSLVREIANRLPLQPSKRPYFYMLHKPSNDIHPKLKALHSGKFIHSTPCKRSVSPDSILWDGANESCQVESTFNQSLAVVPEDAVRKITALEEELNRLRSQIAGFVLEQDVPIMSEFSPPQSSTTVTPPDVFIPAPPPPPPLPPSATGKQSNVAQAARKDTTKPSFRECSTLDMTAILKDLSQVKLKAVERSPGGTPMRRAPLKTRGTDPASIIAEALRNKFAKSRVAAASPDKENFATNSPVNSFSNTPSPQPYFRKQQERKVIIKVSENNARPTVLTELKTNTIPLRV